MMRQPVPHSNLAGHIKKQEKAEHPQDWLPQQMPGARKRGRMCCHRRRHTGCNLKCQRHCGKACDRVAEANPVLAEQIGGDKRRNESAKAEEEVDKVEEAASMYSASIAGQTVRPGAHNAPPHAHNTPTPPTLP